MYEALEPVIADLANLDAMLNSPTSPALVARLSAALDATAERLSGAMPSAATPADRAQLHTLSLGFAATSRVVQQLHEWKSQVETATAH